MKRSKHEDWHAFRLRIKALRFEAKREIANIRKRKITPDQREALRYQMGKQAAAEETLTHIVNYFEVPFYRWLRK